MIAESKVVTNILKRNIDKGLPCSTDSFIDMPDQKANSVLRYRQRGIPSIKGSPPFLAVIM